MVQIFLRPWYLNLPIELKVNYISLVRLMFVVLTPYVEKINKLTDKAHNLKQLNSDFDTDELIVMLAHNFIQI